MSTPIRSGTYNACPYCKEPVRNGETCINSGHDDHTSPSPSAAYPGSITFPGRLTVDAPPVGSETPPTDNLFDDEAAYDLKRPWPEIPAEPDAMRCVKCGKTPSLHSDFECDQWTPVGSGPIALLRAIGQRLLKLGWYMETHWPASTEETTAIIELGSIRDELKKLEPEPASVSPSSEAPTPLFTVVYDNKNETVRVERPASSVETPGGADPEFERLLAHVADASFVCGDWLDDHEEHRGPYAHYAEESDRAEAALRAYVSGLRSTVATLEAALEAQCALTGAYTSDSTEATMEIAALRATVARLTADLSEQNRVHGEACQSILETDASEIASLRSQLTERDADCREAMRAAQESLKGQLTEREDEIARLRDDYNLAIQFIPIDAKDVPERLRYASFAAASSEGTVTPPPENG